MDYAQRLQERVAARRLKMAEVAENLKRTEEELKNGPLREQNPPPSTSTLKIKTQVEVTLDKHCTGMKVTVPKVQVVRGLNFEEKENCTGRGQSSEVLINYKMLHERVQNLREEPRVDDATSARLEGERELEHEGGSKENVDDDSASMEDEMECDKDVGPGGKRSAGEMGAANQQAASEPPAVGESVLRSTVKDHLNRLGKLYGDANLSSPIHRTENNFSAVDECSDASRSVRTPSRSTRLAALASTINSWEDDLKHPHFNKPKEGASVKQGKAATSGTVQSDKGNARHVTWGANVSGAESRSVGFKRFGCFGNTDSDSIASSDEPKADASQSNVLPKKVALDSATLESLEAQGYSRSVSRSRLVYDYGTHASQEEDDKTPPQSPSKLEGKNKILSPVCQTTAQAGSPGVGHSPRMGVAAFRSLAQRGPGSPSNSSTADKMLLKSVAGELGGAAGSSPDKVFGTGSPKMGVSSVSKLASSPEKKFGWSSPRAGVVSSPRKVDLSPGSVLQKAAAFESHSPTKKSVKDPTELPISERLALFERNKGLPPLPKAAISSAVPKKSEVKKQLPMTESSSKAFTAMQKQFSKTDESHAVVPPRVEDGSSSSSTPSSKVLEQLQKFESGVVCDSEAVRLAKEERLKELQALHNRWNKTKQPPPAGPGDDKSEMQKGIEKWHMNRKIDCSHEKKQQADLPPVPSAPPLPSPANEFEFSRPQGVALPEESKHLKVVSTRIQPAPASTTKHQYPAAHVKKIKVSPPKPGKLYPCLSDIEATTTETETDVGDDDYQSVSSTELNSSNHDTSFGREIMEAAGFAKHPQQSLNRDTDDSSNLSEEESAVCDDMDEFLDEALADDSDSDCNVPTPPKKYRVSRSPEDRLRANDSPTTSHSHSFEYVRGESASPSSIAKTTTDGNTRITLTHTISVYRRQQNMKNTPVRQVTRRPDYEQYSQSDNSSTARVEEDISHKISDLLDEVGKQQTVISQASQALNLCSNTIEFTGSSEQVEAERLLLLATHKRQALMNEIQRLKIEGTLKPKSGSQSSEELFDKGNLTVSHITLPLKRDYLRQMAADNTCHHYVCLLRCQEQVLATPMLAMSPENLLAGLSSLVFPGQLRMEGLYGDFKARLEVYTMRTPKEILPHDVKYHIHKDKKDCGKLRLTPKKLMKQDSKLVMPALQSPAGPSAVRTSNFQLTGFIVFSLREIKRTHFTLNKVAFSSPLEGDIQMRLGSELTLDVTERGFLNLYQDVSGLGSLLRRWFVLKGSRLSYWRYPEEEKTMGPLGYIDLNSCITDLVGLVPRSICTRANTFLLEVRRPVQPDDRDSLVMTVESSHTIVRYFLTADTKEERLEWCYQLNKALAMLRAWGALSSQ